MINLLCLSLEMMLRARSMAHTSAVKMGLLTDFVKLPTIYWVSDRVRSMS